MSLASLLVLNLSLSSAIAEDISIPNPIFVRTRSLRAQDFMTIERIAGCYGDLDEARNNIRVSTGILQEPRFQSSSYTKGVFDITTPSCILDDNPIGLRPLNMSTMNYENYLFVQFDCGCGDCSIDGENYFGEDKVFEYATEQHKKDYATYKTKRDKEVAAGTVVHEKYKTEYERWSNIRKEKLKKKLRKTRKKLKEDKENVKKKQKHD